jgi:dolichyl-phosphate-mannose-protein mannosyltransferase
MATATSRKNAPLQKTAPAPAPVQANTNIVRTQPSKKKSYASQGVTDNDVFLLPISDYQVMAVLTVVAAVVRLFRIYQPTSVVFDEVQ